MKVKDAITKIRSQITLSMTFISRVLGLITEPSNSIEDFEVRLKSRWMATIFVILVPFGVIIAMVPTLVDGIPPWQDLKVQTVYGLAIFLLFCYYLSRRGYYRESAIIAISAATIAIYGMSQIDHDPSDLLNDANYLIATLIFSSLMLSQRSTAIILVINVIALLFQPLIFHGLSLADIIKGPLNLLIMIFALVAFGAYLRNALEDYHLKALQTEVSERRRVQDDLQVEVSERRRAQDDLQASLVEKEVLLKEIHHRVKNNLQIISSLLNLQSQSLNEPSTRAQFVDSQHRIRAMALVHEQLYSSDDLARIDFGIYLNVLAGHLRESYRSNYKEVELTIAADDIQFDIDTAIPCGLIINELVSNSLKHAFPNGRDGLIGVEVLYDIVDGYQLMVKDNGVGMPVGFDYRTANSLGLQLVNSLSRQLGGTLEIDTNFDGARFKIRFQHRGTTRRR